MRIKPINNMKKLLSTLLLVLVALVGQAQKVKTWNDVVVGYSNVRILKVKKVTLYADRTEVALHLDFRAGQWMSIAKETYLQAGDKQYLVKDATVIKLGEHYTMPTDTMSFVLTFNPVPQDTKKMDLIEPNGWMMITCAAVTTCPTASSTLTGATMPRATGLSASPPTTLYIIIRCGTSPARRRKRIPTRWH